MGTITSSLIKTDYGLIYSTDGKLCVTVREDDVPFQGVKSFAVETGTTNWFTNPIFQNGENGFDYILNWESRTIKDGGPFGKYIELVDNTTTSVGCHYGAYFNVTQGQTYTFSVYVNVLEWNRDGGIDLYFHWLDSNNNLLLAQASGDLGEERPQDFVGKGWRRYKITATAPTNATKVRAYVYSSIAATSRIQVTGFQFEQLPFASSLVIGTRPAGKCLVLDDETLRRLAVTGFVIGGWFKRNKIVESSDELRLFSCTENGGFNIEKYSGGPLRVQFNDGGTYKLSNLNNQNFLNDLKWHFVLLMYDSASKTVKLYIDGILDNTMVLSSGLQFNSGVNYKLAIGHEYPSDIWFNGLISNFLIAQYNPNVWTNSFIKGIYTDKIPITTATNKLFI